MKIKTIQTFCATALLLFASCEDFLDRQPISDNVDEGFFTAENQLEPYCNKKYDLLPDHGTSINLGRFQTDNNSDDMAGVSPIANFIPQQVKVGISGSYGQHGNLRDCNRFLYYTEKNLKNGTLANSATVQQYIGEMYFFRAYIYFIGSLTQPLFYRGTNIARLKAAKAQEEQAKLTFQQTLFNAGSEVSNALSLYQNTSKKAESRQMQVESAKKASEDTKELFNLGTSTYLEVLSAQQSYLSAQISQVSDCFDKMQAVVSLYQALGGGRED